MHWSVPVATLDSVTPHFAVPLSLSLASSSSSASQKHPHQTSWWLSVPIPGSGDGLQLVWPDLGLSRFAVCPVA